MRRTILTIVLTIFALSNFTTAQILNHDVGVNKILMPDTIYASLPVAVIDVELVNHGMTNVDSFDVCYKLNLQNKKCMTFYKNNHGIADSLIWDTLVVNLDTIMPVLGNFAIIAWTELATDIDNSNDTASKNIFGEPNTIGEQNDFENSISVYPKPAQNTITISGNIKDSEIEIYNLNGSLIRNLGLAKEEELKIDVSDLNSGIYILKVSNDNKVFSEKISILD